MAAGLAVVRHFGLFAANCRLSSFAKASEDTPSSNDLRVACYPKLEERRVVPPDGIEPPTFGLQILCQNTPQHNVA
ncbi:MAG: hypothetical protein EOS75_05295 [Mesorhizobium sp.]|nr:MAG: hypothetical protein EOS75_05295 [Mesorhizobium sp.]